MNIVDTLLMHHDFALDVAEQTYRCTCGERLGSAFRSFVKEDFLGAWARHLRGVFSGVQVFLAATGFEGLPQAPVTRLAAEKHLSLCGKCSEPLHKGTSCRFARKVRALLAADMSRK